MNSSTTLELEDFFPYQLTQLQALVSDSIAQIYLGKFELSRQEWRVLAILANNPPMAAKKIGENANLDKMPASRAIKKMLERQLISKTDHQDDKRSSLLSITDSGVKLYKQLAYLVKERETELLSVLTSKEISQLKLLLSKLEKQAIKTLSNL